jgi:hypothetical protein
MEEAPENGKESSHSAHANGMKELHADSQQTENPLVAGKVHNNQNLHTCIRCPTLIPTV